MTKLSRKLQTLKWHRRLRRFLIGDAARPRLSVFRSNNHIYAQVIDDSAQTTICSASTVDKELREKSEKLSSDCNSSSIVGKLLAKRAIKKGIKRSDAQKYITTLFLALSEDAVVNSKKDLRHLVKESQTPKGLNEQGLREMSKRGAYKSIVNALNKIYKRLNK